MSYLSCPRCGLTICQRHPEIALQYCPRCIAHARIPVLMETSTAASTDSPNPRHTDLAPWNRRLSDVRVVGVLPRADDRPLEVGRVGRAWRLLSSRSLTDVRGPRAGSRHRL